MSAKFASNPACAPIIPIYPVRYAYINIFDDLVPADNPPDVAAMMNSREASDTKGYAIRLLREGWVYIREEDSNQLLHIFKYTQKQNGKSVTESFEKYLFKNKTNAQEGLTLDNSVKQLPFAFVSANTSKISIVYTEHELSPNLIDKIHSNQDVRTRSMQLIDLIPEQSNHSIAANADNLKSLVEDYRDFQDRMLTKIAGDGEELEQLSLDILTTQPSYELATDLIVKQLEKDSCSQERARIVTLFDPVGRQMELSQTHAKLAIWENDYNAMNLYPYTIGEIVNKFLTHQNPDVREMAAENIDTVSHKQYWSSMHQERELFRLRREEVFNLYKKFATGKTEKRDIGSLSAYVVNFIDLEPLVQTNRELEIQKLTELGCAIFEGIATSSEGGAQFTEMIYQAYDEDLKAENAVNVYALFTQSLGRLVTTPQSGFDWDKTIHKALDKTLLWIGPKWALMYADYLYGKPSEWSRAKANALQHTADVLIPKVLEVLGLKLDGSTVKLTGDELGKSLANAINKQVKHGTSKGNQASESIIEAAKSKMKTGQYLFDWGQSEKHGAMAEYDSKVKKWALAQVKSIHSSSERIAFLTDITDSTNQSTTGKIGILFDGSFAGLSAFFNITTIKSIVFQTEYDEREPLKHTGQRYQAIQMVSTISALTVDTLAVARTGMVVGQVATKLLPSGMALRLLPGLNSGAEQLSKLLVGRIALGLIAVANFTAAATSFYDSWHSFHDGQTEVAIGQAATGIGLSLLFVGSTKFFMNLAGGLTISGVGVPAAVACAGIAIVIAGVGLVFAFEKNALEKLLYYCFWGKSKRYPFLEFADSSDLSIKGRIDRAQDISENQLVNNAYQVELQEFMNLLAMPQLILDALYKNKPTYNHWNDMIEEERTYRFQFVLPQFQPGISELHAGIYTRSTSNEYLPKTVSAYDAELTSAFKELVRQALGNTSQSKYENGKLHLDITMRTKQEIKLVWTYAPTSGVIVPLRWLNDDGELESPAVGMINDQFMEER